MRCIASKFLLIEIILSEYLDIMIDWWISRIVLLIKSLTFGRFNSRPQISNNANAT